jgi:Tfp pilus assembly protein PilF/ABC-type tungstate transport system substrate-binding protein
MARTMAKCGISITDGPRHDILLLSLLAVIVVLIYTPSLTTPYIFDDLSNIRDNPHIRIPALSLKNLAWAGFHSPIANRPVANISFALNYYIHGYNPVGFHVVNILIHIATGFFLYFLAKATLATPALKAGYGRFGWIPFFTVFIWIVHPLQTQSVTYLVQRMNSLAAMFYILSMLLYARFRLTVTTRSKWLLFGGCVVSGLLAFGTKEISATLPGFIILYEWYFFQGSSRQWRRSHLLILLGAGLVIVLISLAYFKNAPIARILSSYNHRDFTLVERVLTEFRVVIFYISLLIWPRPSRLNLDHDFALSYSLTDPITTLLAFLVILALIILAVLTARRNPLLSFGILWFFGNLVIESSVIGLELVFEHRNYLPSMLAIMALVALVFRYSKPVWLAVIPLCIAGTVFTVWTFERNRVWADEITLYQDCAAKSPAKARAQNNLGVAFIRHGRLAEAVAQFHKALALKPDYGDAHYNLGSVMARQGNLEQAIYQFKESLRLDPVDIRSLNNLGVALVLLGRHREAMDYLQAALKINPSDADVHSNLGFALMKQGDPDGAVRHLSRALAIDPNHADALNNLGLVLMNQGQIEAAYRLFARALQINPNLEQARRNLAKIEKQRQDRGDLDEQSEPPLNPMHPKTKGHLQKVPSSVSGAGGEN